MGQPAAKKGDQITAIDTHLTLITPLGPVSPLPYAFNGIIDGSLSSNVFIDGQAAATVGSTATNTPPHIPQGTSFIIPPRDKGTIMLGSATVYINNKPAARANDVALTCNDPVDLPVGKVIAVSSVLIGG
jgi:uncharacterized Zn-binding protein involved in type VI secretion